MVRSCFNNCIFVPLRAFFRLSQFIILSRGRKTYRNWRHIIQDFYDKTFVQSLPILIAITSVIPCASFFISTQDQQAETENFTIRLWIISGIILSMAIGYFSWKSLNSSYRVNAGVWICLELATVIFVNSGYWYSKSFDLEGTNLFFVMNYVIAVVTETFLAISLKYEKWNPNVFEIELELQSIPPHYESLLTSHCIDSMGEFLEDYIYFTTTASSPSFVPRCKDFKELYYRHLAEDSPHRIDIPEQEFKDLLKHIRQNEFEESTFIPVFDYCSEVFAARNLPLP